MKNNDLTNSIIGAAIEVHKALGPGLLESAYQEYCTNINLFKTWGIRIRPSNKFSYLTIKKRN